MKNIFRPILVLLLLIICVPTDRTVAIQTCPDNAAALTPAPLQEDWALDWWMPRHEEKLKEEGRDSAEILLVGDSITHGWETKGKDVWKNYFGDFGTYNIGYSGDRTENVLWRFGQGEIDGINPKLAVVMIGTNNTGHRQDSPACTSLGIETIVKELNERLPETRVLLLAVFPREASADGKLRHINNGINQRIEKLADGQQVFFLDINDTFLTDDGVLPEEIMPDLLHPHEYGYQLWAEAMQPKIQELLGK